MTPSSDGEVKCATLVCAKSEAAVGADIADEVFVEDDNDPADDNEDKSVDDDDETDPDGCNSSADASASARSRVTYAPMFRAEVGGTAGDCSTRRFSSRFRREIERAVSCLTLLMLVASSSSSSAAACMAAEKRVSFLLAGLADEWAAKPAPVAVPLAGAASAELEAEDELRLPVPVSADERRGDVAPLAALRCIRRMRALVSAGAPIVMSSGLAAANAGRFFAPDFSSASVASSRSPSPSPRASERSASMPRPSDDNCDSGPAVAAATAA